MMRWSLNLVLLDTIVAWLGLPIGIILASVAFAILKLMEFSEMMQYVLPSLFLLGYSVWIIYLRFHRTHVVTYIPTQAETIEYYEKNTLEAFFSTLRRVLILILLVLVVMGIILTLPFIPLIMLSSASLFTQTLSYILIFIISTVIGGILMFYIISQVEVREREW
jgi:hypothetical protein